MKRRNDSHLIILENPAHANPWNGKVAPKVSTHRAQSGTHVLSVIIKSHIVPCLLACTCFSYGIIIVPIWRYEEHRLVRMMFQDVAFDDSLAGWSGAGNSDPSKGNRLDLEVLRASSEVPSSRFAWSDWILEWRVIVEYNVKILISERNAISRGNLLE